MATPPVRFVSAATLRRMFNNGNYWTRMQAGQLREVIWKESHPTSPAAPVPPCTRSQIVRYFDTTNRQVALVHQYLRPDGTLGASGRPDPKALFESGTLYRVRP